MKWMGFLLFAVLYTAESGKHIILLKFVPCLSKKYTQEFCSCVHTSFEKPS